MKKLLLLMFVVLNANAVEQTNKTIIPKDLANLEGNTSLDLFSGSVPEYQQMFRASTIASEWPTPVKITGMSFRVNGLSGSFDAVIPRIEIRFSTSARAPEQMSTSYAINRGPDETRVYARSDVRFVSPDAPDPQPFDLKFQFDTPFTYDANAGHLLLYFTHEGAAVPLSRPVDAHGYPDINSAPFGIFFQELTGPRPVGIITQFESVAVPEPGSVSLLAFGSAFIWVMKKRMA